MQQKTNNKSSKSSLRKAERKVTLASVRDARVGESEACAYMDTLVDPERYSGVRYPDCHSRKTAVFQGLVNHDCYYFPDESDGNNRIEPPGLYYNVVSPTMNDPVLEYKAENVSHIYALVGCVSNTTEREGIVRLSGSVPASPTPEPQMCLRESEIYALKCDWQWDDQEFSTPPFRANSGTTNEYYGVPTNTNHLTLADSITVRAVFDANTNIVATTGGQNFVTCRAISPYGTTPWKSFLTTGATPPTPGSVPTLFSIASFDQTDIATLRGGKNFVGMPGIGFQVLNTRAPDTVGGSTVQMLSYRISFRYDDIGGNNHAQPRFVAVPLPDQGTYNKTVDQYRVVSASAWLEYEGSDLQNGGQSASIMYAGGQSPNEMGLWDYDLVAETPGGRQGTLKKGSYSYWLPSNDKDMLMRPLNPRTRWDYPFIVNVGRVATPDQINALRLRVPINYEFISRAQFYTYEHPMPDEQAIKLAALVLRSHPTTMDNWDHKAFIRRVTGNARRVVEDVQKYAQDNKHWLIPAARALVSLV